MIEHLRRKITVLVLAVLFLITCLFVAAINLINWHDLNTQAEETLQQLMLGSGDSEPPVPPKNEAGRTGRGCGRAARTIRGTAAAAAGTTGV